MPQRLKAFGLRTEYSLCTEYWSKKKKHFKTGEKKNLLLYKANYRKIFAEGMKFLLLYSCKTTPDIIFFHDFPSFRCHAEYNTRPWS